MRVNLFNPGPTRTRMRAEVMPGEDPMTLPTPDEVAEKILELCLPGFSETGKLYDFLPKNSGICSARVTVRGSIADFSGGAFCRRRVLLWRAA